MQSYAWMSLLRPGDYVSFEVDRNGRGVPETLKSSAWKDWTICTGVGQAPEDGDGTSSAQQTKKTISL